MTTGSRAWIAAAILFGSRASAPALAQEDAPDDWRDDPRAQLRVIVEPYAVVGFSADFDSGGDIAVRRSGWRLSLRQPVSRRWTVALDLENEYSFADYTLPPGLGGGDPVDLLTTVRLLPSLTYRVNRRWTATATGRFEVTGESGADLGGSVLGGVFLTARHKVSDRLTVGFGVGVMQQLEDTVQVFPTPQLDWRPNDRVRVYTDHLGLNLERTLAGPWFVTVRARYQPREYRLDDGAGSLLADGVLRDDSVLLGVELGWRPRPGVEAGLEAGVIAFQQLEVLDPTGEEVFDDNADPTGFIAARLRLRF
ncbi:MAG: hypothetical protein D6693_09580 [Planctomycetota bacterium]|nr:MAG: hypothetical protein D6693_09580 [Planctomycetota bacterium]